MKPFIFLLITAVLLTVPASSIEIAQLLEALQMWRYINMNKPYATWCWPGYYMPLPLKEDSSNSTVCLRCDDNCMTCELAANLCTSCSGSNMSLWIPDQHCYNTTCESGKVFVPKIQPQSNTPVYSGECQPQCPAGSINKTGICQPCHKTCETCSGTRMIHCITCKQGMGLKYKVVNNVMSPVCVACENDCRTCEFNASECTSCKEGMGLKGKKVNGLLTFVCVACENDCRTCEFNASECTSCKEGKFLQDPMFPDCVVNCHGGRYGDPITRTCRFNCSDGYYWDPVMVNPNRCMKCHADCATCHGPNATNCITCKGGYIRTPVPNTSNTTTFLCTLTCQNFNMEDASSGTCVSCAQGCATCNGPNGTNCLSCNEGYVLFAFDNTCVTPSNCRQSPIPTYLSEHLCGLCNETCATCNGPTSGDCLSCPSGRYLSNKYCIPGCPVGFYSDQGQLLSCSASCCGCNGSPLNCTSCAPNKYFYQNKCYDQCPSGTIADGLLNCYHEENHKRLLQSCDSSCATCNGSSAKHCLTCPTGTVLSETVCLSKCPPNQYNNSGICSSCAYGCSTCIGPQNSQCLSCWSNWELFRRSCVDPRCPNGTYRDYNLSCTHCHPHCVICFGPTATNCLACQGGTELSKNNECVPKCPFYAYYDWESGSCTTSY